MPVVEYVYSHWIDLFSTDRDNTVSDDHIFFFGFKNPPDVLVTTSLSALTLGVDLDRRTVGTIGTRVHSYAHFDSKHVLQIKTLPASYEWNSEYISRCISVRVRTSVFFATGTSLSNVYRFTSPSLSERAVGKLTTKTIEASLARAGQTKKSHRTTISGPASALAKDWGRLERMIRDESAVVLGARPSQVRLHVKSGRPRRRKPTVHQLAALRGE